MFDIRETEQYRKWLKTLGDIEKAREMARKYE
jgi:hypothetical protein